MYMCTVWSFVLQERPSQVEVQLVGTKGARFQFLLCVYKHTIGGKVVPHFTAGSLRALLASLGGSYTVDGGRFRVSCKIVREIIDGLYRTSYGFVREIMDACHVVFLTGIDGGNAGPFSKP